MVDRAHAGLLARRAGGDGSEHAIRAALADMATAGHDFAMFSASGNAACAAALGHVISRADDLTEGELVPAVGAAIAAVAAAGHREVGDSEPEAEFEDAANLIAALRGWPAVSRFAFVEHYGHVLDGDRQARADACAAAVDRLTRAHAAEFDTLLAQELARRNLPSGPNPAPSSTR